MADLGGAIVRITDTLASELTEVTAKAMLQVAAFAGGVIQDNIRSSFKPGTGALARSFQSPTFVDAGKGRVAAGVFSDLEYAKIQDQGGTIFPKTVKHLAIPLSKKAGLRWPREWGKGELFMVRPKASGKLLLASGSSGKLTFHYVLKKSVTIRGKEYIAKSRAEVEQKAPEVLARALDRLAAKAARAGQNA